jgi:hypothetical protein
MLMVMTFKPQSARLSDQDDVSIQLNDFIGQVPICNPDQQGGWMMFWA